MFNKSKSKSNSLAELHFISSLQLEHAVRVIGHIVDEKHQVTLTEVNPDEWKFHIDYLPNRSKEAEIRGTLQRWNGTETKIDADGDVFRLTNTRETKAGSAIATIIGQGWLVFPILIGVTGKMR